VCSAAIGHAASRLEALNLERFGSRRHALDRPAAAQLLAEAGTIYCVRTIFLQWQTGPHHCLGVQQAERLGGIAVALVTGVLRTLLKTGAANRDGRLAPASDTLFCGACGIGLKGPACNHDVCTRLYGSRVRRPGPRVIIGLSRTAVGICTSVTPVIVAARQRPQNGDL
jgi:hypothetical protein